MVKRRGARQPQVEQNESGEIPSAFLWGRALSGDSGIPSSLSRDTDARTQEDQASQMTPIRSVLRDESAYAGSDVVHVVKVKVLGLAGIIADINKCSDGNKKGKNKLPSHPSTMRAVVAISRGSSPVGISQITQPSELLRKSAHKVSQDTGGEDGERYVAVWDGEDEKNIGSIFVFETAFQRSDEVEGDTISEKLAKEFAPKDYCLTVALVDSERNDQVAIPIGSTTLSVAVNDPFRRSTSLDLPVQYRSESYPLNTVVFLNNNYLGTPKKYKKGWRIFRKDGTRHSNRKPPSNAQIQAFGSAYSIDPSGDALLRIHLEVVEKGTLTVRGGSKVSTAVASDASVASLYSMKSMSTTDSATSDKVDPQLAAQKSQVLSDVISAIDGDGVENILRGNGATVDKTTVEVTTDTLLARNSQTYIDVVHVHSNQASRSLPSSGLFQASSNSEGSLISGSSPIQGNALSPGHSPIPEYSRSRAGLQTPGESPKHELTMDSERTMKTADMLTDFQELSKELQEINERLQKGQLEKMNEKKKKPAPIEGYDNPAGFFKELTSIFKDRSSKLNSFIAPMEFMNVDAYINKQGKDWPMDSSSFLSNTCIQKTTSDVEEENVEESKKETGNFRGLGSAVCSALDDINARIIEGDGSSLESNSITNGSRTAGTTLGTRGLCAINTVCSADYGNKFGVTKTFSTASGNTGNLSRIQKRVQDILTAADDMKEFQTFSNSTFSGEGSTSSRTTADGEENAEDGSVEEKANSDGEDSTVSGDDDSESDGEDTGSVSEFDSFDDGGQDIPTVEDVVTAVEGTINGFAIGKDGFPIKFDDTFEDGGSVEVKGTYGDGGSVEVGGFFVNGSTISSLDFGANFEDSSLDVAGTVGGQLGETFPGAAFEDGSLEVGGAFENASARIERNFADNSFRAGTVNSLEFETEQKRFIFETENAKKSAIGTQYDPYDTAYLKADQHGVDEQTASTGKYSAFDHVRSHDNSVGSPSKNKTAAISKDDSPKGVEEVDFDQVVDSNYNSSAKQSLSQRLAEMFACQGSTVVDDDGMRYEPHGKGDVPRVVRNYEHHYDDVTEITHDAALNRRYQKERERAREHRRRHSESVSERNNNTLTSCFCPALKNQGSLDDLESFMPATVETRTEDYFAEYDDYSFLNPQMTAAGDVAAGRLRAASGDSFTADSVD